MRRDERELLLRRFHGLGRRGPEGTIVRKERGTQKITKIRYLLVNDDILPLFQRPEGAAAAARGPLSLAEFYEVHAQPAEALDMEADTRRGLRSARRGSLRSAGLRRASRLCLAVNCRGLRSPGRGSDRLCRPFNHHPRARVTRL